MRKTSFTNRSIRDKAIVVMLRPSNEEAGGVDSLAPPIHEEGIEDEDPPRRASRWQPIRAPTLRSSRRVVHVEEWAPCRADAALGDADARGPPVVFRSAPATSRHRQRGIALVAADALDPPFDNGHVQVHPGGRSRRTRRVRLRSDGVLGARARDEPRHHARRARAHDARGRLRRGIGARRREVACGGQARGARSRLPRVRGAMRCWRRTTRTTMPALWNHADRAAATSRARAVLAHTHYVPDGATLVIAGQFDTASPSAGSTYYFREWTGDAARAQSEPATLQPFAFSQVDDGSQIAVQIAFAASGGDTSRSRSRRDARRGDRRCPRTARRELRPRRQLVRHAVVDDPAPGPSTRPRRRRDGAASRSARRAARAVAMRGIPFVTARRRVSRGSRRSIRRRPASPTGRRDLPVRSATPHASPRADHARSTHDRQVAPLLDGIELSRAAIVLRGPEAALRTRTPRSVEAAVLK